MRISATTISLRLMSGCLVPFSAMPSVAQEAAPPAGLIYASMLPGNQDLFVVDGDGARALTHLPGLEYHAAPTPDGRHVVFTSQQGSSPDLWIVDIDGKHARPLYESHVFEDAAEISPDGQSIVFVSDRDGTAGIWLAPFRPDDPKALDAARLLTPEDGSDFRPTFSPDGQWIAYASTREMALNSGSRLWITGVDPSREGSESRLISSEPGWNGSPAFSADGKSIAYHQMLMTSPFEIASASVWQLDLASGERRRLSEETTTAAYPARWPDGGWVWSEQKEGGWRLRAEAEIPSPDRDLVMAAALTSGQWVAHGSGPPELGDSMLPMLAPMVARSYRDVLRVDDLVLELLPLRVAFPDLSPDGKTMATGAMALELVDMATGQKRRVFRPDGLPETIPSVWSPSWSPDGTWLAVTAGDGFASPEAPVDIWRVNADGSNGVNLTPDSSTNDAFADISPDGRWIVFRSGREGQHDLFLIDADGSNIRRLTDDPATDTMPAFSPDGRQIAFTSTRTGNHEVFVLKLDDRGERVDAPRQITDAAGMDVHPSWSPDGKWLVFATDRWGSNDEKDFLPLNIQPYGELAALRLSDHHIVRLTHNSWEDGQISWLPIGLDQVLGPRPGGDSR